MRPATRNVKSLADADVGYAARLYRFVRLSLSHAVSHARKRGRAEEKCGQRALLSHGTGGVFLHHARLHWELLSHRAQCLSASSLWSTFSAALTRPCVDRYHVSTTSEGKSTGPLRPGNSLKLPSAVEAGRQSLVSEGAAGFVIFLPTQFCINLLQNGAAVRNPFNARGRFADAANPVGG